MAGVYSVSQINSYIKRMFSEDFVLNNLSIKGEVSNCKYHTSGHIYFSLKDESGVIACVMFAGNRTGLKFKMEEGQKVIVSGSINVYERDGRYQVYAKEITLEGSGDLYRKFEELKARLEEMGMFSSQYKKEIPRYAMNIGIITAKTGAVIQDIVNITKRRNPYVNLFLYQTLVQGEGAAQSISSAIREMDKMGMDVIIVGRGGGSIEDLWAFNEEITARAVFECETPIISAVGHETDTTIVDFVSDLRAPTPSAAAEIAVFDYAAFIKNLEDYKYTLNKLISINLEFKKNRLDNSKTKLKYLSPGNQILQKRQYVDDLSEKLRNSIINKTKDRRHELSITCEKLKGLSPLNKLGNGYAFVTNEVKMPVSEAENVSLNEILDIRLRDGIIKSRVLEVEKRRMPDV